MSGSRVLDVVLAVQELAANAVRPGAGRGRLRMWAQDGTLCCQVLAGALPSAGREEEAGADPGWSYTKGHGLRLARQVADQMSLESGPSGIRATVTFALR
jgi:anti-sigma regulatory factor (Ser/Thr protein kinase)